MQRTTVEERQRIVAFYNSGLTWDEIAASVGRTKKTVAGVLRREGARFVRADLGTVDDAKVLSLYEQGLPWTEVAAQAGCSVKTVGNVLQRHGVQPHRRRFFTDDQKAEIVDAYMDGDTAHEIAERLDCDSSGVYYVLRGAGIARRHPIGLTNKTFFDVIDTEEKAYWLGFIAADGCVAGMDRGYPWLQIKLARKDRGHLDKLHAALGADRPVIDNEQMSAGKMREYSTLAVHSSDLVASLIRQGITPRKTLTLQPWIGPPDLMRHYWRGLVDGDGSMTRTPKMWLVSLVGSRDVISAFATWAGSVCSTKATARPSRSGNYWSCQVGGTVGVRDLVAALYAGCTVALDRKKALADRVIAGE